MTLTFDGRFTQTSSWTVDSWVAGGGPISPTNRVAQWNLRPDSVGRARLGLVTSPTRPGNGYTTKATVLRQDDVRNIVGAGVVSGTFDLGYNGFTDTGIPFNISHQDLETRMNGWSTIISAGGVVVCPFTLANVGSYTPDSYAPLGSSYDGVTANKYYICFNTGGTHPAFTLTSHTSGGTVILGTGCDFGQPWANSYQRSTGGTAWQNIDQSPTLYRTAPGLDAYYGCSIMLPSTDTWWGSEAMSLGNGSFLQVTELLQAAGGGWLTSGSTTGGGSVWEFDLACGGQGASLIDPRFKIGLQVDSSGFNPAWQWAWTDAAVLQYDTWYDFVIFVRWTKTIANGIFEVYQRINTGNVFTGPLIKVYSTLTGEGGGPSTGVRTTPASAPGDAGFGGQFMSSAPSIYTGNAGPFTVYGSGWLFASTLADADPQTYAPPAASHRRRVTMLVTN